MNWILTLSLFLFFSCNQETCHNGATNTPKCDQCPQGKIFMEGQCAILVTPPSQEEVKENGIQRNP